MRYSYLPCFFLLISIGAFAQPYVQAQYGVTVEKNVSYGTAKDFAGNDASLLLDIYKPVGNVDTNRPIYLHFHGGAWAEISNKDQVEDVAICKEMAQKGYVVANVEYRRGYHRLSYYVPYAFCNTVVFPGINTCIYVQDTSEIIRAIYRGMQDAKAAIRFMKGRNTIDSTNVNTVCIGGESAGGFVAMYAGYLTCSDEKPLACGLLSDALVTDADLAACNPSTISLARPDLGSIEGTVNLNGYDATVIGVANYYGGIMHPILPGPNPPALYLFHQTNDVVVDCNAKMPFQSFFEQVIYPLNLCQPLYTVPKAWGCCSIRDMLVAQGSNSPVFAAQIVNNGLPNSFANPPGHSYDNIVLRSTQAATLFSPFITGQAQAPAGTNCVVGQQQPRSADLNINISPNPFQVSINLEINTDEESPASIALVDVFGRVILTKKTLLQTGENTIQLNCSNCTSGIYFIQIETIDHKWSAKVIRY